MHNYLKALLDPPLKPGETRTLTVTVGGVSQTYTVSFSAGHAWIEWTEEDRQTRPSGPSTASEVRMADGRECIAKDPREWDWTGSADFVIVAYKP